jgi:hypothetical protein
LKNSKYEKLKYQTIDTTFIRNLYGTEILQRNPAYKSKNEIKVSSINDINGVPISYAIGKGATNDAKIGIEQMNNNFIDTDIYQVRNNNKYKQYIYGDSQYHTNDFYKSAEESGYTPITDVNIRNTKDGKK